MSNVLEFTQVSEEMGVNFKALPKAEAESIIASVKEKFNPAKLSGHLAIGEAGEQFPLESYEFKYSEVLEGSGFIFFDQEGADRSKVLLIDDLSKVCKVMSNSFGMEYFVASKDLSFLISVNWYVIEISSNKKMIEKFRSLEVG